MRTFVKGERLYHLDGLFDLWYFAGDALVGSDKLAFCQAISVVLLIEESENWI